MEEHTVFVVDPNDVLASIEDTLKEFPKDMKEFYQEYLADEDNPEPKRVHIIVEEVDNDF